MFLDYLSLSWLELCKVSMKSIITEWTLTTRGCFMVFYCFWLFGKETCCIGGPWFPDTHISLFVSLFLCFFYLSSSKFDTDAGGNQAHESSKSIADVRMLPFQHDVTIGSLCWKIVKFYPTFILQSKRSSKD